MATPEPEPEYDNEVLLKTFSELPGGKFCADCGRADPTWASSEIGALICLQCSGVHRLIGPEFSKVLSVKLDDWDAPFVEAMSQGNDAVNANWEAALGSGTKPTVESSRDDVETFIWSKYAKKNFCAGGSGEFEALPVREGEVRSSSDIGVKVYGGVLMCMLKSGKGLKDMDTFGKSDPYVVAAVEGAPQEAVSKVIDNDLNPEWNEMMIMNVPDPSKRLRMKCFDSDAGGDKHVVKNRSKDDIIGDALDPEDGLLGISIASLVPGEAKVFTAKLLDLNAKDGKHLHTGELTFELTWNPLDQ